MTFIVSVWPPFRMTKATGWFCRGGSQTRCPVLPKSALNEAIYRFGPPDIMNSDQGSQFTSFAWTDRLRRSGARILMDGKGRYLDNIFIERLWRTLKYECVYLHAWETGSQARAGVRKRMEFYNYRRPHKAVGGRPPAVFYSLQIAATQPDQQEQIRA
ncbi:MAG: transposase [Pararhodobacter sp.]